MKQQKKNYLLRLFIFWMIFFFIGRSSFLLLLFQTQPSSVMNGWAYSFIYSLPLDLATAAYLLVIPTLLYITALIFKRQVLIHVMQFINKVYLLLVLLILSSNIAVYKTWGTMINARAISFLQDPEGIIASLSTIQLTGILLYILISYWMLLRLYDKNCGLSTDIQTKPALLPQFILLMLLPLMMRGGLREIPINESASFYSESMPLNHAATNPAWYLLNNLLKSGLKKENPYQYFSQEKLKVLTSGLQQQGPDTTQLFTTHRPNIILVVLESWSADLIAPLGGYDSITPHFNQLCSSGYLFTEIYSSGRRTDQMFPSVLSGFPAQPNHSLSRFSDKLHRLPMLPKSLKQEGYYSSFIYGGELGFANMKSFLTEAGFNKIIGKEEFSDEEMNSKWGAHDEFIFKKAIDESRHYKAPFFQMILTLSTHEPFEVPGDENKPGTEQQKFLNAAHYTDQCIGKFMTQAMKEPWFSNTIFIFVADHGHAVPKGRAYYDPQCYHIPLLITGAPLKPEYRGNSNSHYGGQHEVPNTILKQLGIDATDYSLGSSLTSASRSYPVYLNYDDGFCVLTKNVSYAFHFGEQKEIKAYTQVHNQDDSLVVEKGKAFLQHLYNRFLQL